MASSARTTRAWKAKRRDGSEGQASVIAIWPRESNRGCVRISRIPSSSSATTGLFPSCVLHRADEFKEWFRCHFFIASHSAFLAVVVNNAQSELQAVGLADRRGHGVGQAEKIGRCDQSL